MIFCERLREVINDDDSSTWKECGEPASAGKWRGKYYCQHCFDMVWGEHSLPQGMTMEDILGNAGAVDVSVEEI